MARKLIPWLLLLLALCASACTVLLTFNGKLSSVQIVPANPKILVGAKIQFFAVATFTDGLVLQLTDSGVKWTSSTPAVATISSTGVATGLAAGNATITATFENLSASTALTVSTSAPRAMVSGTANQLELSFLETGQKFLYIADPLRDIIAVYQVDPSTGARRALGETSVAPASAPVWLAADPDGNWLYVANHRTASVSAFAIDPASGRLAAVPGSPFELEVIPWSVAVDPQGEFVLATPLDSRRVIRLRIDRSSGALNRSPQ